MAAGFVPPRRGRLAAGAAPWLLGPRVLAGRTGSLADMATTIEARGRVRPLGLPEPGPGPTLIVAGGADHVYGRELFAETARLIPGSRLRVFDGRGHVTVTTHPEFAPEIGGFLGP
jgi:pimeloyl-ACP methyl ester carboxylesterase